MKQTLKILTILLIAPLAALNADDPILIAHRGLIRHAPENTLPAFASCLELGMGFELDIRTTKDGKLVVLHDVTLARTTDGPDRPVTEFTWNQLREFDAGSWFDPRFTDLRVPSLEETFALIQKRKRRSTLIALNIKGITRDGERELVRLLAEFELFEESFAFDQSVECSQRLKALDPRIRIGRNVRREELQARLDEGLVDSFLLTFVPTPEESALLREHEKQIHFNYAGEGEHRRNESNWLRAREVGINGMLTDYPLECAALWRDQPQLEVVVSPNATVVEREGITGGGYGVMTKTRAYVTFPNHPDDFGGSVGTASALSTDGGRTWTDGEDNWPIPDTVDLWIDRLNNGDLLAFGIRWVPDPAKRRDPTPPEVPADAYQIGISSDHGKTWELARATIDCPPEVGFIARPLRRIIETHNGKLLMPAYTWSKSGNKSVLLESADRGRSWRVRSVITRAVDMIQAGAKVTTPWLETSVSTTGDGSLLATVRSGSTSASHIVSVRSNDGGLMWGAPQVLPFPGKLPTLNLLDNGVLTLVTALSKHHCRIYVSADGSGRSWDDAHVISSMTGSNVGANVVGPNQLMITTPAQRRIDAWKVAIGPPAKTAPSLAPPSEIRFNKSVLSWKSSPDAAACRIKPILIESGAIFPETPSLPYAIIQTTDDTPKIDLRRQLLQGGVYAFEIASVDEEGRVSAFVRSAEFRP
ncbi:glycerophosphodiester phosphodiesterase family protein [Verrucomicrobiales bacterium]|nr:glycerophosphodiester phosphodiesterase family protein [Verrucomicrobiales bacterium]